MFEAIVSKITNAVRNMVRAVGAAMRCSPWLAAIAVLGLFLIWCGR